MKLLIGLRPLNFAIKTSREEDEREYGERSLKEEITAITCLLYYENYTCFSFFFGIHVTFVSKDTKNYFPKRRK